MCVCYGSVGAKSSQYVCVFVMAVLELKVYSVCVFVMAVLELKVHSMCVCLLWQC